MCFARLFALISLLTRGMAWIVSRPDKRVNNLQKSAILNAKNSRYRIDVNFLNNVLEKSA